MYIFAGDSWAEKAFTPLNWQHSRAEPGDVRLADYWHRPYQAVTRPGGSNIDIMWDIVALQTDWPIVWIWTEPGRDYGFVDDAGWTHGWMQSELWQEKRRMAEFFILSEIQRHIPNPIAFIGGLSDIDPDTVEEMGFDCLCSSWQGWIAAQQPWSAFELGWGASDVGWRTHTIPNFRPGRSVTLAWDQQIKEWCAWEDSGWFCHEHPSPQACEQFGTAMKPRVEAWLDECR